MPVSFSKDIRPMFREVEDDYQWRTDGYQR